MIVALTGATGFLGGHVLRRLLDAGHNVRALTRRSQPDQDRVDWVEGSLERPGSLIALATGCDVVVHVAGVVNAPGAADFDRSNRQGTANLLAAATVASVRRFVYVSSLSAREPNLSQYGTSKRAAEDAVKASPLDWIVIRPPAIYGPGDTDNLELFKFARRGFVPLPPDGRMSVIHADDLARLIVVLASSGDTRMLFEADDGHLNGWSHAEYARMIADAVGHNAAILKLPKILLHAGARIDGKIRGSKAKLTRDRVSYMTHPDWVIDPTKRPPAAVWQPGIVTAQGLRDTAVWYRAQGWL